MSDRSASPSRRHPAKAPLFERLEQRQLLALVMDLRMPGGAKTATITKVGQVINLELWAKATGTDGNSANEGFQNAFGGLISTNVGLGAALGDLTATPIAPFNGTASHTGAAVDADGDLDIDVGKAGDYLFVRSNTLQTAGGVAITQGQEFKVANVTFKVTKLLAGSGAATNLYYHRQVTKINIGADATWQEDGTRTSAGAAYPGTMLDGEPVVLNRNICTIAGKVWNDKNADGIRQSTEGGAGVWRVYIDSNKNKHLDAGELSVLSTSGGNYSFNNLKAGTYRIRIIPREGWHRTKPTGSFYDINLGVGDAAFRNWGQTQNVIIFGKVFSDNNSSGTDDAGDAPLGGWRVFVDLNNNSQYDTKQDLGLLTDANGIFTTSILPAGNYTVRTLKPDNYNMTVPSNGSYALSLTPGVASQNLLFGLKKIA